LFLLDDSAKQPPSSDFGVDRTLPSHRGGAEKSTPSLPAPDTDARKKQGVVKFQGTGRAPSPSGILVKHKFSGKLTYICANHSTQGFCCRFDDKNCNFFHITKLADLPREHHDVYKKWVNDTRGISLARSG
jgi:hypothetical protein